MIRRIFGLLCVAALTASPAMAGNAHVTNGWFRVLPNHLPAAGYFSLRNTGTSPILLVGARSPACGKLMLHMTHNMGGMTHMMAVENVEVPPGGSVDFAPGGYHLMCTDPNLVPGTSVAVTLNFKDGETVQANFQAMNAMGR